MIHVHAPLAWFLPVAKRNKNPTGACAECEDTRELVSPPLEYGTPGVCAECAQALNEEREGELP